MSKLRFFGFLLLLACSPCYAQSPALGTQDPESGVVGGTFIISLPLVNTGTESANDLQVTAVSLGHAALLSPSLPSPRGPFAASDPDMLVLEFDTHNLVIGQRYLLTIRGTYQVGGKLFGFAVNRFVTVTGASSSVQNDLEQWVGIAAVNTKILSLPGIDAAADNQELLAFLQGRPEFVKAGVDTNTSSVWATFQDGSPFIIANDRNFPGDSVPASESRRSAATLQADFKDRAMQAVEASRVTPAATGGSGQPPSELPESSSFLLLNAFGSLGSKSGDALVDIATWLKKEEYQPAAGDGSVLSLMSSVVNLGVFYISTHAGVNNDQNVFALWTTTELTPDLNHFFDVRGDLNNTVVKMAVDQARFDPVLGKWFPATHYGITAKFVRSYFLFPENSFVFIDACGANNPLDSKAVDMRNAFFAVHASVFEGWTSDVHDSKAAATAKLIFDRLLGANKFALETLATPTGGVFKQRPFDWTSANFDAGLHEDCPGGGSSTCGDDGDTGALLIGASNPRGSHFGLLAPSISNISANELGGQGGFLTINGIFGSDQSVGSVTVGGEDAHIESWSATQIIVDLTLSGAGSAGDVVVTVRDHKSNVARLTEWKGNKFVETISGNGSLQLVTTFNIHFRLDMREYRSAIHNAPVEPTGVTVGAADADGTYSASGSGTGTDRTVSKWSGTGSLVGVTLSLPITGVVFYENTVQIVDSKKLNVTVGAGTEANAGATCTQIFPGPPSTTSTDPHGLPIAGPSNLAFLIGDPGPRSFPFELDSDFAIKSSFFQAFGAALDPSYVCMDETKKATYNFKWGPLSPTTNSAPDPDSAR